MGRYFTREDGLVFLDETRVGDKERHQGSMRDLSLNVTWTLAAVGRPSLSFRDTDH